MPADVEQSCVEMMARDHARMRLAGGRLAEAAVRVIHDYDGLHRLSLAVAGWAEAIAAEGDRGHRNKAHLDEVIAAEVANGLSLRAAAKRFGVGVGRVRGAVARNPRP